MKFTVNTKELVKALNSALIATVPPKNCPTPRLYCGYIVLDDGDKTVRITTSDGEKQISVSLDAIKSSGSDAVLIPLQTLRDLAMTLGEETEIKASGQDIIVLEGGSSSKIKGYDTGDFVFLESVTGYVNDCLVEGDKFQAILKDVCPAISDDKNRPVLNAIFIGNSSVMTADGFRGTIEKVDFMWDNDNTVKAIVPEKAVRALSKLEGDIRIFVYENYVSFRSRTMKIKVLVVEGQYPDIERIVPKTFKHIFRVSAEMVQSLKRAAIMAKHSDWIAKLNFKGGQLSIIADSSEYGSTLDVLDVEGDDEVNIMLNVEFLQDAISVGGQIEFAINDGKSPVRITSSRNENLTMVLMPMNK